MRVIVEGAVAVPTPARLSLLLMVTRSPPAMGATPVIRLVTVPFPAEARVSSYTQVFPTAAGKSDEPVARPLPDVPEADEALAVAFPDATDPELDVVLELEPELQAVRTSPATAMAAAKTAGLRDVMVGKLDRFISLP